MSPQRYVNKVTFCKAHCLQFLDNGLCIKPLKCLFLPQPFLLRLLNEIIADFDELLGDERFRAIDKIKTIGSTYMAAIGLIPELRIQEEREDGGVSAITAVTELAEYVFGMREKLANLNEHSYNNFMLRVSMLSVARSLEKFSGPP